MLEEFGYAPAGTDDQLYADPPEAVAVRVVLCPRHNEGPLEDVRFMVEIPEFAVM